MIILIQLLAIALDAIAIIMSVIGLINHFKSIKPKSRTYPKYKFILLTLKYQK